MTRHAHAACDALLRGFRGGQGAEACEEVFDALRQMRAALRTRRSRLASILERHGLRVSNLSPAGLFLFPNLAPLEGRIFVDREGHRHTLSRETVVETLRDHCGLQLNTGRWAGAPGHARICFSLTEDAFEVALRRLECFFEALEASS